MATRDDVRGLLDAGASYAGAAKTLGITPGGAYLIATGRPADGSDGRYFTDPRDPLESSPQRLVGPPPVNPTRNPAVEAWIRERATRELTQSS